MDNVCGFVGVFTNYNNNTIFKLYILYQFYSVIILRTKLKYKQTRFFQTAPRYPRRLAEVNTETNLSHIQERHEEAGHLFGTWLKTGTNLTTA